MGVWIPHVIVSSKRGVVFCALWSLTCLHTNQTKHKSFENQQSKVSTNYKLLESISIAALQTQVQVLDRLLQKVSRELFSLQEVVLNSPMRVTIKLKEQDVDYEVGAGNKAPAPAPAPAAEAKKAKA